MLAFARPAMGDVVSFQTQAVPDDAVENIIFSFPIFRINIPDNDSQRGFVTIFHDSAGLTELVDFNPTIDVRFAYDTNAPAVPGSTANEAEYEANQIEVDLIDPSTGELITLTSNTPVVSVSNDAGASNRDSVGLGHGFPLEGVPVSGEVPFSSFTITNDNPQSVSFDLFDPFLGIITEAAHSDFVSQIQALGVEIPLVRYVEPEVVTLTSFGVSFTDNSGIALDSTDLPLDYQLSDYTFAFASFGFDGIADVFVDPTDYESTEAFELVSAWVEENILSVMASDLVSYEFTSIQSNTQAIPVPGAFAGGLMLMGVAAIRRNHRKH